MLKSLFERSGPTAVIWSLLLALSLVAPAAVMGDSDSDSDSDSDGPTVIVELPVTTQGPLWPPAEMTNEDGDFLLVGLGLFEFEGFPGSFPLFNQALLVSKDSVPPLDEDGNKSTNWFLAPHDVIRPLDLSDGSPDLDLVLYALSMGPPDEFGFTRIPREGDSEFNLGTDRHPCQEVFPSGIQRDVYTRARFPLHQVPIWGLQGDQVAYDVDTGAPFEPISRTGPGCEEGCPGEDLIDRRPRREPITLGDWLQGNGKMKVTLTDFDEDAGGYTAADFTFRVKDLIPNGMYTVWTIRPRRIPGTNFVPQADPLGLPNTIVTDKKGNGKATIRAIHPFPDPVGPEGHLRIIGVVVAFHPDYQTWGACGGLLGAGVDLHSHLNTIVNGTLDITDFVTVAPSGE